MKEDIPFFECPDKSFEQGLENGLLWQYDVRDGMEESISGLVGLVPQEGRTVVVDPMLPADTWDWFCLDNVLYHGYVLTVLWDRNGDKYGRGKGLQVLAENARIAGSNDLTCVRGELP